MKTTSSSRRTFAAALGGAPLALSIYNASKSLADETPVNVNTIRVPDGGIQPQITTGPDGLVHLIYYKGDAGHGDLFYVRSRDEGATFSSPIRVNSQEGSSIAAGTIRGGQIAVGRKGRVHVAWNGSNSLSPQDQSIPTPASPANQCCMHGWMIPAQSSSCNEISCLPRLAWTEAEASRRIDREECTWLGMDVRPTLPKERAADRSF